MESSGGDSRPSVLQAYRDREAGSPSSAAAAPRVDRLQLMLWPGGPSPFIPARPRTDHGLCSLSRRLDTRAADKVDKSMTKRSPDNRPPISASTRPISGRPWARQSDSSGLRDQPYQLDFPLTSPAAVEPHVRLGLGRDKPADTCLALGLIRADRTDVSGSAGREGARSSARRGEPGAGAAAG